MLVFVFCYPYDIFQGGPVACFGFVCCAADKVWIQRGTVYEGNGADEQNGAELHGEGAEE